MLVVTACETPELRFLSFGHCAGKLSAKVVEEVNGSEAVSCHWIAEKSGCSEILIIARANDITFNKDKARVLVLALGQNEFVRLKTELSHLAIDGFKVCWAECLEKLVPEERISQKLHGCFVLSGHLGLSTDRLVAHFRGH